VKISFPRLSSTFTDQQNSLTFPQTCANPEFNNKPQTKQQTQYSAERTLAMEGDSSRSCGVDLRSLGNEEKSMVVWSHNAMWRHVELFLSRIVTSAPNIARLHRMLAHRVNCECIQAIDNSQRMLHWCFYE